MAKKYKASTAALSLDEVISRLSKQQAVDGLLVVGSAVKMELSPASDYDIVLVLSSMPASLHTGVTYTDGRFTDLVFHTSDELGQILAATEAFDFGDWTGRLVGWLQEGEIYFDRHGQLADAQAKVCNGTWLVPVNDREKYGVWQRVNYNLAVVRRYLTTDDPTYLAAADLRMAIYAPSDLFWGYFTARGFQPDSEKQRMLYLQKHDPSFLALFNRFLCEPDRQEKFHQYIELAEKVLTPIGSLWQAGETILNLNTNTVTPQLEEEALRFWATLISS